MWMELIRVELINLIVEALQEDSNVYSIVIDGCPDDGFRRQRCQCTPRLRGWRACGQVAIDCRFAPNAEIELGSGTDERSTDET